MYVSRGILCVEATAAGVPSFTFEIGEGGRLEPEVIAEGVRCIRNGLIGLGMIDGACVAPKANYVMRDFLGIRVKRGGFLFVFVRSTTLSTISVGERVANPGCVLEKNNRKVEPCH